jgi:hypothetical protein
MSTDARPDPVTLRKFALGDLPADEWNRVARYLEANPPSPDTLAEPAADTFVSALRSAPIDAPADPPELQSIIDAAAKLVPNVATAVFDKTDSIPFEPTTETVVPPKPGERLGRFRIERVLGRGGMGVVYAAADDQLGRRVALKTMAPQLAANPVAKERFLREARAAAQIEHDNIVPILEVGEDRGIPFIAMPLLRGQSLDDRLANGILNLDETLAIARDMTDGIAAAHDRGLIHRDIKPSNLWLEANDDGSFRRVRLLDFGLARQETDADRVTKSGTILGTPAYMAPEQARGESVDARADLFSLGCVLYRATTGQNAFKGTDTYSLLTSLALDRPKAPIELNTDLPRPLSELIVNLLEKDAKDRPASARAVRERLAAITSTVPAPARRRGRALPIAAIALSLIGLVGVLFGGTIVRIATNKGELVVEIHDGENVEIVVKQNGAVVVDKTKDRRFVLTATDGEIEFLDPDTGVTTQTKTFRLTRGGVDRVVARMGEAAKAKGELVKNASTDRRAAEWALKLGGKVTIVEGGNHDTIDSAKSLPTGSFQLVDVYLYRTPVTDDSLEMLQPVTHLTKLGLEATAISDRGLESIKELKNLTFLNLQATKITNTGLTHLRGLTKLTHLSIHDNQERIDDRCTDHLLGLKKLLSLDLRGTNFGDTGVKRLKNLPALEYLALQETKVTDEGLDSLKDISTLQVLLLDNTRVTDTGLTALSKCRSLVEVGLTHTSVSKVGVEQFARTLPTCRIVWSGGVIEPNRVFATLASSITAPAKDSLRAPLAEYQLFDAATPGSPFLGGKDGNTFALRNGVYTVELPAVEAGTGVGHYYGRSTGTDAAFVARARRENGIFAVNFRHQATATRWTWIEFRIEPDGSWRIQRVTAPAENKKLGPRTTTVLAQSTVSDGSLAEGQWFTIAGRSTLREFELWANGRRLAAGNVGEAMDAVPADPVGIEIAAIAARKGRLKFELDHVAVWDWTAAPDRNLFPDRLAIQDDFADAKKATLFQGRRNEVEFDVRDGAYRMRVERGKAKWGLIQSAGAPAPNVVFSARMKASNANLIATFRNRGNATRSNWLEAQVQPDGSWKLLRLDADGVGVDHRRTESTLADGRLPAGSFRDGDWLTIAGRSHGAEFELWLNGLSVAKGRDEKPFELTSSFPAAIQLGGVMLSDGAGSVVVDHYAIWDGGVIEPKASPSPARLTAEQRKNLEAILARGGYMSMSRPGQPVQYISKGGQLPNDDLFPFDVGIAMREGETPESILELVRRLPRGIQTLNMHYMPLTGADLKTVVELPNLADLLHLSIPSWKITDNDLKQLQRLSKLQTISLNYTSSITAAGIAHLRGLPLETLGILKCSVDDSAMDTILSFRGLKQLGLSHSQISVKGIARLRELPKLESLAVGGPSATPEAMAEIAKCPNIVEFSIETFSNAALVHLPKFPKLEVISLYCDEAPTPEVLAALAKCPRLRKVTFYEKSVTAEHARQLATLLPNAKITWDGGVIEPKATADAERALALWTLARGDRVALAVGENIVHPKTAAELPKDGYSIAEVQLANASDADLAALAPLWRALPAGRERTLFLAGTVSNSGLDSLRGCAIHRLSLIRVPVSDDGLPTLAEFPGLRRLEFDGTRITDAGLAALAKCPNLVHVDLLNTTIGDAGLRTLAELPTLHSLTLTNTAATAAGLDTLATRAKMQQLTLSGTIGKDAKNLGTPLGRMATLRTLYVITDALTDDDVKAIAPNPITSLGLGSPRLTGNALEHVAAMKTLVTLHLESNVQFSEAAIQKLAAALPACRIHWAGGVIEPRKK